MLVLSLLPGCVNVPGSNQVRIDADVPTMSTNCDPDATDTTNDVGDRVAGWVALEGDQCVGTAYARVEALDWADVKKDAGKKKLTFEQFVASLDSASVVTDPEIPLAGVSIELLQIVATESGDLGRWDSDPQALIAQLGTVPASKIKGSDVYTVSLAHVFVGDEPDNLVDLLPNGLDDYAVNKPGPISTIEASYAKDPAIHVLTVGRVQVPLDTLQGELPGGADSVDITIDLEEAIDYQATVHLL